MTISVIKAQQIVSAGLGLLVRELTLPQLMWRDAGGDFAGALSDTISIRLPAYATARTRVLRSGTTRTRDSLAEHKVDVTLDTDIYKDVKITDEELTLDISNFGEQVLNPVMNGIVQKIEDKAATLMTGATYANTLVHDISDAVPYKDIALAARKKLNDARVPQTGRSLVVGSTIESELLADDKFIRADYMGQTSAMREGQLGRVAGFDVFPSSAVDPSEAYAFHRTAFVVSSRAPVVPDGAPWGVTKAFGGYALRMVQVMDSATIEDILATDLWLGTNTVADDGYFDSSGRFWPNEGPTATPVTLATSAAADDIIDTATTHGYAAGDLVVFPSLTGGAGLTAKQGYYVIAANLAATTFQVSATPGGSAVNFTTDITAGTVAKGGTPLFVRAVKITSQA